MVCWTEMIFLNGIVSHARYLGKTWVFSARAFVWFSTLIFLFYKMLFINRLEFSCSADFFCFYSHRRVWFLYYTPVAGTVNSYGGKDSSLLLNWCPKILWTSYLKVRWKGVGGGRGWLRLSCTETIIHLLHWKTSILYIPVSVQWEVEKILL